MLSIAPGLTIATLHAPADPPLASRRWSFRGIGSVEPIIIIIITIIIITIIIIIITSPYPLLHARAIICTS